VTIELILGTLVAYKKKHAAAEEKVKEEKMIEEECSNET